MRSKSRHELLSEALCAAAGGGLWAWMFGLRAQGFDITDESFYLFWLADPSQFPVSLSQFGFVYHPLFDSLGGDIASLRCANLTITWLCGTIFARQVFASSRPDEGNFGNVALSLGLGATALLVFDNGLMTPSYNSLALQSLLIAAAGAIRLASLADSPGFTHRKSWPAMAMLALGSALLAMAKISSAALLAPIIATYLLASGPHSEWRGRLRIVSAAAVAAGAALLLLAMIIFPGGMGELCRRVQGAMSIAGVLSDGHELSAIFRLDIPRLDRIALVMIGEVCGVTGLLTMMGEHKATKGVLVVIMAAAAFVISLVENLDPTSGPLRVDLYQRLVILAIPLVALLGRLSAKVPRLPGRRWLVAIMSGALPFVFAFGSNTHYWQLAGAAAIFWVVGAMALVGDRVPMLLLSAVALILTAWLLALGVLHPYRQPGSLGRFADQLMVSPAASLRVDAGLASQVAALRRNASAASFVPGTAIIDLSGQSPGLVYLLGGESPGQPWLIGGYPGSSASARRMLGLAPCTELGAAWVLSEPDGPRALPDDVVAVFGANLTSDYGVATSWDTVTGFRDGTPPRRQSLLRPLRPPATAESGCFAARSGRH